MLYKTSCILSCIFPFGMPQSYITVPVAIPLGTIASNNIVQTLMSEQVVGKHP